MLKGAAGGDYVDFLFGVLAVLLEGVAEFEAVAGGADAEGVGIGV